MAALVVMIRKLERKRNVPNHHRCCYCVQIFHKPLLDCELLTEKEVAMIFVNWKELIMCNIKLLK